MNKYLHPRKPTNIKEQFGYNEYLSATQIVSQPSSSYTGIYINKYRTTPLVPQFSIEYAKPNLQVDIEKATNKYPLVIIPPFNTRIVHKNSCHHIRDM